MKLKLKYNFIFLLITIVFFASSIMAFADEARTPTYTISRNMKSAAENTTLGNGTASQQPGLWGTWGGTDFTYAPGAAEDGVTSALHITGGSGGGGGQLAFDAGDFGAGAVTHTDADGTVIGTTKGFVDATEFVIRLKSTSSFSVKLYAEYRTVTPYKDLYSKSITIPSTDGQWKDIVIPFKSLEPDTDGKWIYNLCGAYAGNFSPVILLRMDGVNFGSTKEATIGELRVNWYKEDMVRDVEVSGLKKTYYQNYDHSFDYNSGNVSITYGDSSVKVNDSTVLSGTASNMIGLTNGDSTIQVDSKAKDGTQKTYNIKVHSTAGSNTNINGLILSYGTLDQPFNRDITSYKVNLPNSISSLNITPIFEDPNTTALVDGAVYTTRCNISSGTQVIPVVIIAPDGTKKRYDITVTRGDSSIENADLYDLTLSKGYLDQPVNLNVFEYSAKVSNTTSSITVKPIKVDGVSTIKVNGTTVSSGSSSAAINLNVGENDIVVEVTSKSTFVVKTYHFRVTREDVNNTNADLFLATMSVGTLNEAFHREINDYTQTVENTTTSIKITPTAADANAKITVNGTAVTSGSISGSISLNVGDNIITVVVTANDTITKKTYTFKVNRKAAGVLNTDATLFDLTASSGKLSETFDPNTTTYTMTVANNISSIMFKPTKSNVSASIKVSGSTVTSGAFSKVINLNVGSNAVTAVVTAQDTSKTKTYTINVTREAQNNSNADLFALVLSKGVLGTEFSRQATNYTAKVSSETRSITVTPVKADASATIKVNGTTVDSGVASLPIALTYGDNTITVEVTAQDGTVKTYTITVTRTVQTETNADLLSIVPSQGILSPAFSSDITEYTLLVPNSIGRVSVTPTKADTNETLQTLSLTDPRVSISKFKTDTIYDYQDDSKNYGVTVTTLNVPIVNRVRIVAFLPPDLTGITVVAPKLNYNVNDVFDVKAGKIIATYSDKPDEEVALDDKNVSVAGFNSGAIATGQVIIITYGGKSFTYTINVNDFRPPTLQSITMQGVRTLYKVGEVYNYAAGKIIAHYSDKPDQTVDLYNPYVTITGFDSSQPVEGQVITVYYGGQTTTYQIYVISGDIPYVRSLENNMQDSNRPASWGGWHGTSVVYVAGLSEDGTGDALKISGGSAGGGILAMTNGGFGSGSVTASDGYVMKGFNASAGLKIRYKSNANFSIRFYEEFRVSGSPTLSSSTISSPSSNGEWTEILIPMSAFGGSGDWQWYNYLQSAYVNTDYEPALQMRIENITYTSEQYAIIGDMKFFWSENDAVKGITAEGLKTTYYVGDAFDYNTGVLHTDYAYKSAGNTPLGYATISGFDSSAPLQGQTVTITYAGKSYTYQINILSAPVDLAYTSCTFENLSGTQISSFGTEEGVVANVQVTNPSEADAQQKGVLFATLYNGNKLVGMKRFGEGTIPAGTSVITTQFTSTELANVTKIKVIAFVDGSKQQPIFEIVPQIER